MKTFPALAVLSLIALQASADVTPGRYTGHTDAGAPCGLDVLAVRFEGDIPHPLNERVDVRLENGAAFTLAHLPLINRDASRVRPEGGKLTGTRGVRGAGDAVILEMIHSETYTGPESLTIIHDDYKDAAKSTRIDCLQVRRQGE